MKIRRHYLTLRRNFPQLGEHEPIEATTEELAAVLDCTQRNMMLLLKRMQHEGWLSWSARRGRGNRSELVFLAPLQDMLLQEAKQYADKQNLQAALELLRFDSSSGTRHQFQEWLSEQFGFHSELQGDKLMDVLRFPMPQRIHSLDPVSIHYAGESHLVNQLFDGLVRVNDKGGVIMPHLAHAWECDASRTLWTFYLRKGVLFHNGREMVAEDVRYSLERLKRLAPQGLYSSVYTNILHITVIKNTTVQIKLARRNELFLSFLATNRAVIVPEEACEGSAGSFSQKPVGTGPFKLAGHEGDVWVLEAFTPYFLGRSFLDRVEVWTMEQADERVKVSGDDADGGQALQQPNEQLGRPSAHFQLMHNVRITDMAAEEWQQVRQSGMTCKFITVNETKQGPLQHEANRARVDAAIDRSWLINQLAGDVIEPAHSFWPAGSEPPGQSEAAAAEDGAAPPADVALTASAATLKPAAAGSEAASWQGAPLVLATIQQYETDAALVKQLCAQAGIPVIVRCLTAEQFQGAERMAADLLLFAVMLDEHRELRLLELLRSMQQHMPLPLHNAVEQRLDVLLTEADAGQRKQHFIHIESMLAERRSLLFLYRKHLKTAFHPSIRGISLESLSWVRFRDIWHT